jgi:protein-disulfide isomerase
MHLTHRPLAIAAALLTLAGCDVASAAPDANTLSASAASPLASDDTAATNLLARADLGRIEGRTAATVWLIVISDFQCPFCKKWHEETGPIIEREYVNTGKVRIAYLNLPISSHRNAQPAHEVAMCAAEQGKFWPVADALFATQERWKSRVEPEPFFDSLAVRLVDDDARYRRCITSGVTRPLIDADVQRVTRIGVGSTPSFIIGQQMVVGAQPVATFRRLLDAALAGTAPAR